MKFKDVVSESHVGSSDFHDPGKPGHIDTGISPTGHVTGEYGEVLLPVDKKLKKKRDSKKSRKNSPNISEGLAVTGTKDVTGVPVNIEVYADKKKKDKIVRRVVGLVRNKITL